jgi:predicted O-methyltransferase YrrM
MTPTEQGQAQPIEGQLNAAERELLLKGIIEAARPPKVALEVGTWLGGGSTLHILRAFEANGQGHLWGIEANRAIYDRMLANLRAGAPGSVPRFTPLFGFSQDVIPEWLAQQSPGFEIDFVFLDGGNNPGEQITEFQLLDPHMPVGAQLMAHDAKFRKGKWLVPYLTRLDHWRMEVHDISREGLLYARKIAREPSPASLKAARRLLFKARLELAELAAAILPARVCGFILGCLPRNAATRLSDGKNARFG